MKSTAELTTMVTVTMTLAEAELLRSLVKRPFTPNESVEIFRLREDLHYELNERVNTAMNLLKDALNGISYN